MLMYHGWKRLQLVLVGLLALAARGSHSQDAWGEDSGERCPRLYPKKFVGYTPIGNLTAGNYTEQPTLTVLRACIMGCCMSDTCNVVFKVDDKCYHVECYSDELCMPLLRTESPKLSTHATMILVKPVLPNESWEDMLANYGDRISSKEETEYPRRHDLLEEDSDLMELPSELAGPLLSRARLMRPSEYLDGDFLVSSYVGKVCQVAEDCPLNAQCKMVRLMSRKGICECKPGYKERGGEGRCTALFSKDSAEQPGEEGAESLKSEVRSDQKPVQKLIVSNVSQAIELPTNKATLTVYVIPDEKTTQAHYNYAWTLVDQSKGGFTGNINQNGGTVTLTELTEGEYNFKVAVNGTGWYGEGFANVTVLPAKRTNTPPLAVITPVAQTIKLPTSGAVLDGGASKDDDAIISWHWEVAAGPIGYQPQLPEGQTLVLADLTPGNYTFKLTVEDSDHVKNSTTANITVLNHTDYPPEANAGQDVIVYLPNNNLTLNGSLSTDDHEIVSWEWTKAAEDENKAVDMQNTHSPYLQLSNLSEGVYTFLLKVTDSSGQSSTADVHVFVKPPTNTPPVAVAGEHQYVTLPQTWAVLNGTASHDDHRIVAYTWSMISGPSDATIVGYNESVANATALTKGTYQFRLTVLDDNGNSASDNITVDVVQTENKPPKADGGGDQILTLPVGVLVLNGSRSTDDFRIVSWRWRRAPQGLAAGTVVLHSDTTPVLMVTDIVAGRYVFELTVTDDQDASDTDTVSVQVKPSPLERHLLEMTLNEPAASFTAAQLESLTQKLTLLLKEGFSVNVTQVRSELDTDNTQIIFYLHEQGVAVEGERALSLVRAAGWGGGGGGAGGAAVARLRSVLCLSACSGRGVCEQSTRACRCDAFWMQNIFTQLDSDAEPNCEWSVVYASLGGVAALATVAGGCWGAVRGTRRLCAAARRQAPPRKKYTLLPANNHEDMPFTSNNVSDTETDSDVLFETRSRESSFSNRLLNGDTPQHPAHTPHHTNNGHFKPSRKVKA